MSCVENVKIAALGEHMRARDSERERLDTEHQYADRVARRRAVFRLAEVFDLVERVPSPASLVEADMPGNDGSVFDCELDELVFRVFTAEDPPVVVWRDGDDQTIVTGLPHLGGLLARAEERRAL